MALDRETRMLLDGLQKQMTALSKPASQVQKGEVFAASYGERTPEWGNPVVQKRLAQLAKSYPGNDALVNFLAKDSAGRPRGIGLGPALKAMAGIANPNIAANADYGQEQLEKEHGFATVEKAASIGIKGLNGEVRKVALAEGSGQTGGYVVPPQFIAQLQTIAAEDAFVEPRATVMPMASRTMTLPMLDITTAQATGTSPYFAGLLATWLPEATSLSETEPQFRQTDWTAWDLCLYTVSSNQLLQDNAVGLDALLTQLFSKAITWYKEYAFLRGLGAGSSMPLGIINAPATYVQSRSAGGAFTLADAAAMMSRLHVRSWDSACWIMHQSVIPKLIQMVDPATNGHLVWLNPVMPGGSGPAANKLPKAFLNGLPIFFTEKMPTLGTKGDVMLCDLSMYVIGNRMDLQIDVSPHVNFRTNQMAWRVIARCDGKPWLNNVITDANGWVSSPLVCLNT